MTVILYVTYLFCCAIPHCDNMPHFKQVGNYATTHQPQTQEPYSEEQRTKKNTTQQI